MHDQKILLKVGMDLRGGGTIGLSRINVKFSKIHHFKRYINLILDNQQIFKNTDTATVFRAAAYRLYKYLDKSDKKKFEAIRVTIKGNLLTELDTSNFFRMIDLEKINKNEEVVNKYLIALKNNDTTLIYSYFDTTKYHYTKIELDSINLFFRKKIKDSFDKSKLYNWGNYTSKNVKYKQLLFLTDTSNNCNVSFRFRLNDSIKGYKDVVGIKY